MKFKYSAKTRDGKITKKGEIEAPNQKSAIDILRQKELVVYSIVPISDKDNHGGIFSKIGGVGLNDKVKFTEQLSSMVSAGLAITKALEILSIQTKNKKLSNIVSQLLNDVESGSQLSESLSKFPEVFNESYISLVRAGESSGKLDEVLLRLSENLEKERQFKSKVKGALIYPSIIFIAMILVFAMIILFVIPKLTVMYESLNVELPFATKVMLAMSEFALTYWWLIIIVVIASIYGFMFYKKTPAGAKSIALIGFKMPIFGNLTKQSNLVEITRTLGLLIQSGVPIVDSLEIVETATSNIIYKEAVQRFTIDVKHGYPLSQSISKETYFPPIVANMVVVGEETGTVDKSLQNLSKYFEGEVDKVVKNLTTAMEPLIMIFLGIMVGILVISVITPIYKLTSQF